MSGLFIFLIVGNNDGFAFVNYGIFVDMGSIPIILFLRRLVEFFEQQFMSFYKNL